MGKFELSLFISRSPQEVFDYITNTDNDLLWQKNLQSSEWITPEPHGIGSAKRVVTQFMGRKMEATAQYTVWNPPNKYSFQVDDGPFLVVGTTRFEPEDDGTQLTLEARIETYGILRPIEGLLIRQAKKLDTSNFNELKRLLEES